MVQVVLLFLTSSLFACNAFLPRFSPRNGHILLQGGDRTCTVRTTSSSTLQRMLLSSMDSMTLVNTAEYCADDDDICIIEEEDAVMNRLESQAHLLEMKLDEIRSLVYALQQQHEQMPPMIMMTDDGMEEETIPVGIHVGGGYRTPGGDLSQMSFMGLLNTARLFLEEGSGYDEEYRQALINTLSHQYNVWNVRFVDTVSSLRRLYDHRSNRSYLSDLHAYEVNSLMESIGTRLRMDYHHHHPMHHIDMNDPSNTIVDVVDTNNEEVVPDESSALVVTNETF